MYDITNRRTFDRVNWQFQGIDDEKSGIRISKALVGNKCDLEETQRKVPTEDAEKFAKSKGITFLEASAFTKINVKESFVKVVHDLLGKTQEKQKAGLLGKMCGCQII